jgi:Ras family
VSPQEGRALADSSGAAFFEASAKSGENIHAVFLKLGNAAQVYLTIIIDFSQPSI